MLTMDIDAHLIKCQEMYFGASRATPEKMAASMMFQVRLTVGFWQPIKGSCKERPGRGRAPRERRKRPVWAARHLMRLPDYSDQFKRDVKQAQKRGKNMEKLKALLSLLIDGKPIPAAYLDHPLKGGGRGFRDAHVEPDWLLI